MRAKLIELTEKQYEDKLSDVFGDVDICGLNFSAGYAFKTIDPIAFRCAMADEPETWECDECKTEHEDQDEAEKCCEVKI